MNCIFQSGHLISKSISIKSLSIVKEGVGIKYAKNKKGSKMKSKTILILFMLLSIGQNLYGAAVTNNINTYSYGKTVAFSNVVMNGAIDLQGNSMTNAGTIHVTNIVVSGNGTFEGGGTINADTLTTTNLTMRGGNIALGSGYLSNDGDSKGLTIHNTSGDAAFTRNIVMSGQLTATGDQNFNAVNLYGYSTNFSVAPYFSGFMAGGAVASPTAMLADKTMFYLSGRGHTGAAFSGSRATMYFTAAENWATNANGSYIWFQVTPKLSVSPATAMRIDHDRAVRLYNMTTAPTTGSGYGVIAASNNVINVWPGSGDTALKVNGNIALGSGYLSGDGDNEGVSVDSSGGVRLNRTTAYPYLGNLATISGGLTVDPIVQVGLIDTTAGSTSINFLRAYGTETAPQATTNNSGGQFTFRGYDGANWSLKSSIQFQAAQNWLVGTNGVRINMAVTPNNSATMATALVIDHDRAVRYYNMTTAPTTGSGYGVIAATNNEMYVWDGAGNRTLLSPHEDENNELVKRSDNPYTGVSEEINLTRLAQAVEELLPKDHALKGTIYKRIVAEPSADWRANEKRQAADRDAERAQWDQADAAYKAELAKWALLPMADKARLTQPTKQDDQPKPEPYTSRPIPTWAAEAQKRFDSKHVEAVEK